MKILVFEMINVCNQLVYAQKKTAARAAVSPSQGNIFSNYKKVNKRFGHLFVRDYSTKLAKRAFNFKDKVFKASLQGVFLKIIQNRSTYRQQKDTNNLKNTNIRIFLYRINLIPIRKFTKSEL